MRELSSPLNGFGSPMGKLFDYWFLASGQISLVGRWVDGRAW